MAGAEVAQGRVRFYSEAEVGRDGNPVEQHKQIVSTPCTSNSFFVEAGKRLRRRLESSIEHQIIDEAEVPALELSLLVLWSPLLT
jgi:hypothetical protein